MRKLTALIALAALALLSGCASVGREHESTSSLVSFLYPQGQDTPLSEQPAHLHLPVKVGIVFVPSSRRSGGPNFAGATVGSLSMADQITLLDKVAGHFRKYPFVKTVEVIPTGYLAPGGGFANLDVLAAMYDIDIVALVSYDQVQNTDEGALSFLYLTIVGAYTIPAEKDTTTTFVDTAVFDVRSRRLLFRAPGISRDTGHGTLVNNSANLRDESLAGFDAAFLQMTDNLDTALGDFKQKVKDETETYRVSYAQGYSGGGGAYGVWLLLGLAGLWCMRRQRTHAARSSVS